MKKVFLFLIGVSAWSDLSFAGEKTHEMGVKQSWISSLVAVMTFKNPLRTVSPDSVTQLEEYQSPKISVIKSSKSRLCELHQPTAGVVYLQENDIAKHKVSMNRVPTLLTLSPSQDDLSLSLPTSRSISLEEGFGHYVSACDSPKAQGSPKALISRTNSFDVNRPLSFSSKPSSFDSTTSSYNELQGLSPRKIIKRAGVTQSCPISPISSPGDHVVDSPSPENK
jgi:hypothetical protein